MVKDINDTYKMMMMMTMMMMVMLMMMIAMMMIIINMLRWGLLADRYGLPIRGYWQTVWSANKRLLADRV